jgi:hypothetical protein
LQAAVAYHLKLQKKVNQNMNALQVYAACVHQAFEPHIIVVANIQHIAND